MTACRPAGRKRAIAGFTLVEVLISLALMAIVVSFLSGGLTFGRRAWETSAAHDEAFAIEAGRAAIRDVLRRAIPLRPDPDRPGLAFEGRQDSLSFVALADPDTESGGLRIVRLRSDNSSEGIVFIAQSLPESAGLAASMATDRETVLFKDLSAVQVRYYAIDGQTGAGAWHRTWVDQSFLPSAIELRITFRASRPPIAIIAKVAP